MERQIDTIDVEIRKPLFANFVNIRDTYLRSAIREGKMLRITIPQGTAVVDPREWVRTGKKVEQVFLQPDNPMKLYGNYVPVGKAEPEQLEVEQLSLL